MLWLRGVRRSATCTWAGAVEVVQVEALDDFAEGAELIFADAVFGLGLALGVGGGGVGLRGNAGLLENRFLGVDSDAGADGDGDGVRGARVELYMAALDVEHEAGVIDAV